MNRRIPTFSEISPSEGLSLDEKAAASHFLGKSSHEAFEMMAKNMLYYLEYFKYMGPKAFSYYFNSLVIYLMSDLNEFDDNVLISVIQTIELRIKYDPPSVLEARESIMDAMVFFDENYSRYEVDEDIYGDLRFLMRDICVWLKS
jgi:hypothetical protein